MTRPMPSLCPAAAVVCALLLAGPAAAAGKKAPAKAATPATSATAPTGGPPDTAPAPDAPATPAAADAANPAPAEEPAPKVAPKNRSLEYAKDLLRQGRGDQALRELDNAASLPGNTAAISLEIAAARAQALLLQKKPAEFAARELMVEVLHQDPDGGLFEGAPAAVQALLEKIRAEQVFVLHERVAVSKPGRPVKLKARLVDPQAKVSGVTLHFKGHAVGGWSTDAFRRDTSGYSGFIRDPGSLAPAGVTDGFVVDYFLTAEDAAGRVVDANGSEDAPLQVEVSSTRVGEEAPVDLSALELRENPVPVVVTPPSTGKPWYLRWYTLTGAGVVVVATGVVAYAATREKPLDPHIGILFLP